MPIGGDKYEFSQKNVDGSPAQAGVYALYDNLQISYYGRAQGDTVTIRSRLQSHKAGRDGVCTQGATHYRREPTSTPIAREKELLDEYKTSNGKLPRCNERAG